MTVPRVIAVLLFWCVATSGFAGPIGADNARFLLTRTGFAAAPAEIDAYKTLSKRQAVDRLLEQSVARAVTPPPAWTGEPPLPYRRIRDKSEDEQKAFRQRQRWRAVELRAWWVQEMLATPSPLTERMTLFWHNHFVSSLQKVHYPELMYRQNVLLRHDALGNFGVLLHAVSKDPAMLIYLDGVGSRKGAPNENFAREVMELFTLGQAHYTERDVKEAARAFTGWSIDRDSGRYRWRPAMHDDGIKTLLGRSGDLDGDAALDIILSQPACAEFIVGKLWREFISPEPNPVEVARIARQFRDSGYEIKVALRALFLSPAFWDAENRGTLVKSPVEMTIGAVRQFQFSYDDPLPFAFAIAQLGQNLFNPPNVKGWPGGDDWINSTTLLARKSILDRLFRAVPAPRHPATNMAMTGRADLQKMQGQDGVGRAGRTQLAHAMASISYRPDAWLEQIDVPPHIALNAVEREAIRRAVLPLPPSQAIDARPRGVDYLRALVMDPIYQLK